MKRSALALLTSAVFIVSGCISTAPEASTQAAAGPAPTAAALPDATLKELSDAGLEYFDRDLPNRAAHRAAWHLQEKKG